MSKLLLKILSFAAIAMIFVWSLVPVLFIVINSFRFPRDILIYPPPINTNFSFDNYFDLVKNYPTFFGYMGNSAIIAISATVIGVIVSACAGYVYSRFPGRFTSISGFYLIAVRLLPGLVISIPLFPLVGYLGLMDTHAILILLYVTFWVSVNTFVMKAFIDQIPKELDEAALIDGASSLQVLFKIILPLSAQGMVAAAVVPSGQRVRAALASRPVRPLVWNALMLAGLIMLAGAVGGVAAASSLAAVAVLRSRRAEVVVAAVAVVTGSVLVIAAGPWPGSRAAVDDLVVQLLVLVAVALTLVSSDPLTGARSLRRPQRMSGRSTT